MSMPVNVYEPRAADRANALHDLKKLSWFSPRSCPVPILFAIMIALWIADLEHTYVYPGLIRGLYFVFSTVASGLIAFLIAQSFRYQGRPGLLMIGCGAIIWGTAGLLIGLPDINQDITFFNLCVWLSASCHFAGAVISLRSRASTHATGLSIGLGYTIAVLAVLFVRMVALEDLLPRFFIQGYGGTPLRQAVLGSAAAMFIATASLLLSRKRRASQFQKWYAPALLLIATGVFGVMIQSHHSSLLGWTGRTAQFLGGVYMLIAAVASVRESRAWSITIENAFSETKQAYADLVDLAADGILIHELPSENDSGRFVESNKAMTSILGYTRDELLSLSMLEIVRADDRQEFISRFEKIRPGDTFHHEQTFMTKDGRSVPVEMSTRLFVRQGRQTALCIVRDIAERKKAEAAIKSLAQFPRENPNAVMRATADGTLLFSNMPAVKWLSKFGGDLGGSLPSALRAMVAEARERLLEREISTPDGQVHLATAVRPTGEDYVNLYGIDITERKRSEDALRESERRYRDMLSRVQLASVTLDRNAQVTFCNDYLLRLTGRQREEVLGANWFDLFIPPENNDLRGAFADLLSDSPATWHHENEILTRSGERRLIRWNNSVLHSPSGEVVGTASIGEDITERKQAEESLRLLNENLENTVKERTAAIVAANEELEQRATQLRMLAGQLTMSEQHERRRLAKVLHDGLQQYLVAAKLQLGSLAEEIPSDSLKKSASEIEKLLSDSVTVSRSLAAELSPPILHDAGLLSGLEWLSRWMLQKHRLTVELKMQTSAPALEDDVKVLVFESVRELLLNAVKHAETNEATVELSQPDRVSLEVSVSDNGRGFNPGQITTGEGGSGFGLFSITERISYIGGKFAIVSSPGKGARFSIIVPLGPDKLLVPTFEKQRAGAIVRSNTSESEKARILLADDHPVMLEGLARLLANEPDFEVIGQASDGQHAVDVAGRLRPNVILMDISMPRLDGIEATRIIHAQHPDIQIIGLSLYTEEERAREMLGAGATFYLSKSGPPSDLKTAIRGCMQKLNELRGQRGRPAEAG